MTQVGESVSVGKILQHSKNNCYFCKENKDETPDPPPESKDEAEWEEDDGELIGNDPGELECNRRDNSNDPRPNDWLIRETTKSRKANHRVTPNPHHLIPGNESLKQVPDLLEWIFEDRGQIKNDIGYNVNNELNGIWLPSNNSMRGDSRWKDEKFKVSYAERAMKKAGGSFHDRHNNPYSAFVTKILQKIADRMWGFESQDFDCPFHTEGESDDELYEPPYALISRLNGVSIRLRGYLQRINRPNKQVYTSRLVQEVWKKQGHD